MALGRPKGSTNHITHEVRGAIARFASGNVHKMNGWLGAVAATDPAKAMSLYLQALEYFVPKLARTEVVGDPNAPLQVQHKLEGGAAYFTMLVRPQNDFINAVPTEDDRPVLEHAPVQIADDGDDIASS